MLQQQLQIAPRNEVQSLDQFLRLSPPSFRGESDPKKADLWIVEMEKKFKVMRCLKEERVNLATYMFQGQAEYWWHAL